MATEFKGVSIVPLHGTNYPTWKLQCKMALIREGLWGIVNSSEMASHDAAEASKFSARKNRALTTIVLSIDPSLLYLIRDPDDRVAV